jgi:Na+/H+-dicarboxylate symporter
MTSKYFALYVLGGALLGFLIANLLPNWEWLDDSTLVAKTIYLNALKMVVVPLIFFSLLSGVLNLRKSRNLSQVGGYTLIYYLGTTAIATLIGLTIVLIFNPWTDITPISINSQTDITFISENDGSLKSVLLNLLNKMLINPFTALSEYNILGILTFAILFGLALATSLPESSQIPALIDQVSAAIYQLIGWVIKLLPIGIFAITFQLANSIGLGTFAALGELAIVVFLATLFHGLVVLPLIAWIFGGVGPGQLFTKIVQPLITALSTSSSAATLPVSMATAQDKFKVTPEISSVVLPLGATVNMDGTALFEGVAAVFLAQMFGIPLDPITITTIFLVAMMASIGAPGIPSGSMAGMQLVLLSIGIPLEAIALLLIIERPLDTFRTAVNVEGDLVGCIFVSKKAQST